MDDELRAICHCEERSSLLLRGDCFVGESALLAMTEKVTLERLSRLEQAMAEEIKALEQLLK